MHRHWKNLIQFTLGALVVATFVLQPFSMVGEAKRAYAAPATEATQLRNTAVQTMNTILTGSLELKEYGLDNIAFFIAKMALQSITQSLVTWINSGFQGRPAFVTDLKQHLLETADLAIGEFLEDTDFAFLCAPFALDVQIALSHSIAKDMSNRDSYQPDACTLSEAGRNVERFLSGDFIGGGGWSNWFEMTQKPMQNTAVGQAYSLQFALQAKIANAEGEEIQLLNFGDGFLSFKQCDESGRNCTINTPGQVISNALSFQLDSGRQTLIEADEINEIFNALFYQLANRVIGGIGGLLGATTNPSNTYFSDSNERTRSSAPGTPGSPYIDSQFQAIFPRGFASSTLSESDLDEISDVVDVIGDEIGSTTATTTGPDSDSSVDPI